MTLAVSNIVYVDMLKEW